MSRSKEGIDNLGVQLLGKALKEPDLKLAEFLRRDLEVAKVLEQAFKMEKKLRGTILGYAVNFALGAGLIANDEYETSQKLLEDVEKKMGDDANLMLYASVTELHNSLLDECSI